jgi:serine/threonine protein kinase
MSTKQERRVLEIVNHPFIVKLHYAFQTGPALCLVMDFINGGELFMHLRKHRSFSESDARIWAAQILLALEYLHSMGIIYRDIKPENVLLDREGHIKLTDFGLARDATDMSTATEVAGSPYYMAPEVLLMQGHDVQADWWSLGILIYEMITGLPPFYSKDTKAAYHRLMSEPLEFKEHVSVQARELITGLLNTDPAKRLGAVDR